MKRGPKPAPTAVKLAKGTRSDRINECEVGPASGTVEIPADLSDGAKLVWAEIAPMLLTMRVLTPVDVPMLRLYCESQDRLRRALNELSNSTMTTMTERGGERPSPLLKIIRDETSVCLRILAEFGCSPSSRARISVEPDVAQNPLALFISRRP